MKTAILTALIAFGVAATISLFVAALMKLIFLVIRRLNAPRKS